MTISDIFEKFGFPVAITIVLILAICYLHKEHKEEIKSLRAEYKQDMEKMQGDFQTTIKDITETHSREMKEVTKSMNRLSDSIDNLISSIQ
mgnify:CR=1 FL=1